MKNVKTAVKTVSRTIFFCMVCILLLQSCTPQNTGNAGDDAQTTTYENTEITTEEETMAITESQDLENQAPATYGEYAEWGQQMLIKNFWNETEQYFNNTVPEDEEENKQPHYWIKSHALEALVDGYERTGDKAYADRAKQVIKSIIARNGNTLSNDFYDDMEWLCIAALRMYNLTEDMAWKAYANKLWADIKTAWWEDETGGMAWKKTQRESRNACSNSPAGIIAARMYQSFGDEADLKFCLKIYKFMTDYLVDPDNGLIYDGLELKLDGKTYINKAWLFTYNAGTFIGMANELYKITNDGQYLLAAEKTARGSMEFFANANGVLRDEGQGDGGMFKGILVRYLACLYETNRDSAIKDFLYKNADSLVTKGSTQEKGIFGNTWDKIYRTSIDLSVQLSGQFALEAAAKIEKLG